MSKLIFLDFAETLGYRAYNEIDSDILLLKEQVREENQINRDIYETFLKKSNLYDRSLSFHDLDEEKRFTTKHFFDFLVSVGVDKNYVEKQSEEVTEKKYSTLYHSLYPEVTETLMAYRDLGKIYVISDGRPSRRLTLEMLGLMDYCQDCFISDEIGVTKDNPSFYKKIIETVGQSKDIVFIDDIVKNLETFDSVFTITGYLMDRHGSNSGYNGKYILVNKLPDLK